MVVLLVPWISSFGLVQSTTTRVSTTTLSQLMGQVGSPDATPWSFKFKEASVSAAETTPTRSHLMGCTLDPIVPAILLKH